MFSGMPRIAAGSEPEEPEQRPMGVDGQHIPLDALGQPRQQGPAQTDGCATAQAFGLPPDSVADSDVDTFILEISLLIRNRYYNPTFPMCV